MLLEKWIFHHIANKEKSPEELELVYHGIETFLSDLSCITCALILSAAAGECIGGMLFVVAFSTLRTFSGGWHANSRIYCFLSYCSMICLFLILLKLLFPVWVLTVILAAGSAVVWLLAPTEHRLNPLSEREYFRNRIKSRILILTLLLLYGILYRMQNTLFEVIVWAVFFDSFLMLMLRFSRNWRYYAGN